MGVGFRFWDNMKETLDLYDYDKSFKCAIYDALVEYGLYGELPEVVDERTGFIRGLIQSWKPSLDKGRVDSEEAAAKSSLGGKNSCKITDEQIEEAVVKATQIKMKIPTRKDIVDAVNEIFGIEISEKTISRNMPDSKKKEIAIKVLDDIKNVPDVPKIIKGTEGQIRDMSSCPDVPKIEIGTQGQDRDIENVPMSSNDPREVAKRFDF